MTLAAHQAEWNASWADARSGNAPLHLYALVDCAMDRRAMARIQTDGLQAECLFGYALDAPAAASTPKLIEIDEPSASPLLNWILREACTRPVVTLIGSTNPLRSIAQHLRQFIDVQLKGLDSMYLAVWDPAILGTLVGQVDDLTRHVPGPALSRQQRTQLLHPISHWWYWDREGGLHDAARHSPNGHVALPGVQDEAQATCVPIVLEPWQVDQLVEASIPDHLLQHIAQNQPELLDRVPEKERYRFVRQQLARARGHGLQGTGDLVNYVCLAMAFGARFDEQPGAAPALARIRAEHLSFDGVMDQLDEPALTAGAQAPRAL